LLRKYIVYSFLCQ